MSLDRHAEDSNHPKRRRWDGHVDRLPYETERFDGGEKARLTYRDFDGSQCAVDVEVGEYMSHNSWLLLFDDDGSGDEHIVRADGVVLLQTYPDEEISEIGYAEKVDPIALPDGGRAEDDSATHRYPGTEERTADSVARVTYRSLERGTLVRYLGPGESIDLPADRVEVTALD